jgi:uncharacterized ferritin-like protein (DUF455 family)
MELRAFAERILFATTLEEKLAAPEGELADETPGPAMVAPAMPGRPAGLRFKPAGREAKADIPGLHELEREHERGRLLHFFANHELLATELMALVLLRFPDAPAAFRRGVLRTLRDEQEHTRLYLARMGTCGVRFGDLPVSGYFWRAVANMESPMDYVAGLSLTFEQANLDFARHFAQGFTAVGDATTGQLLERIYRDEIAHVAYGLKWFRRWKNPTESDWDAFCRQLKFPLSPQRAKGVMLNVAGRRAAGFDADFIAELEIFARSRGRTPAVFCFNPFAEGFIARGSAFSPGKLQRQLADDLAHLPMFLARKDDIVLVPQRPPAELLRDFQHAGLALPEFVTDPAISLVGRKLGRLQPWAWSPDSLALLAPFFPQVTGDRRTPHECFNPAIAELFSKTWSARFLQRWLGGRTESWLCSCDDVGVSVRTLEEALAAIAAIRARGHHRVVAKEALGLAGQNALRLWEPEILPAQHRWLERALGSGRELVIEPWQERVADFSMQGEMTEHRGLQLAGFTGLDSDHAGRFLGNSAAPNFAKRLPAKVAACFAEPPDIAERLHRLFDELRVALATEFTRIGYLGPVGIDAFVFRDAQGVARLKPVVEINPRYTMGRVTLELMRYVAPGSFGHFRIFNRAAVRATGADTFAAFAAGLAQREPIVRAGKPVAKIVSGAFVLNDAASARSVLATFSVRRA